MNKDLINKADVMRNYGSELSKTFGIPFDLTGDADLLPIHTKNLETSIQQTNLCKTSYAGLGIQTQLVDNTLIKKAMDKAGGF